MINTEKIFSLPKLGKDDTFTFGCNRCGNCCREREDILLTPLDLFKMAGYLNAPSVDVLSKYCEMYEGRDSKLPLVRIKPREYRGTCPFAKKEGCRIHAVKPAVCALFPLGRMTDVRTNEFSYLLQPVTCGNNNQTQTVRQWLVGFSMLEEEGFTMMWHKKAGELSTVLRDIYSRSTSNHETINAGLFVILYLQYDLSGEFMPQFEDNCDEALRIIRAISEEAVQVNTGDCCLEQP